MNIFEKIKEEVAPFLDNTAVVEFTRKTTYRDLINKSELIAADFKNFNFNSYDRVAFICEDSIEYIILSLVILKLNAVVVPISPSLSWDEINNVLDRIDVNFVLFDESVYKSESAQKINLEKYGFIKGFCILKRSAVNSLPTEYVDLDPAFIRFSSGTTGASKGVVLSHQDIIDRTDAANRVLKITSQDQIVWVLSMSFHFVVTILLFLRKAATIVLCTQEFPQSLIEALNLNKITFLYASPFHYYLMLKSDDFNSGMLKNIRMAVSTAMKLSVDCALEFNKKFNIVLAEAYGIIEVGLPFINTSGNVTKFGSVGNLLPAYQMKIVDDDEQGVGTVYLKGKGMMSAYFSPWQNRSQILVDGWFNTGDLGKVDFDGYLHIVGRVKNLINFSGMKIFPYEVEEVINKFDGVLESYVYGQEHSQYGQLPCVQLVVKDKNSFDVQQLRKFCYQNMAQYKVPKDFIIVDNLPKTISGKIKRDTF